MNNQTRGSERMKEDLASSLNDVIPANNRTRGSERMKEILASSLADAIPANNRARGWDRIIIIIIEEPSSNPGLPRA